MLGAASSGAVVVIVLRRRFTIHLNRLEADLRAPDAAKDRRSHLSPDVVAFAARLGLRAQEVPDFVAFEQSGQMWRMPGGKPMAFMARQTIRVSAPGFLWRATMGPVMVADYCVAGLGGLEAMLLGAFPIARIIGGAAANRGEILRYLAELPWCPEAILGNSALDWTLLDAKTIKVATGAGAARGGVTFELDDDGLIVRASAQSRPYADLKGRTTEHPWRGRFWDYQRIGGRLMPMQGEAAWGLPAGDFVYWRGRILGGEAGHASAKQRHRDCGKRLKIAD